MVDSKGNCLGYHIIAILNRVVVRIIFRVRVRLFRYNLCYEYDAGRFEAIAKISKDDITPTLVVVHYQ